MNLIGDKFDDMQKTNGFLRKIRTPIFLIALFLCLSFSIRSGFCEEPKDKKALANFKTTIDKTSRAGISISYKIAEK